jgi:hypothetical protein
MSQIDQQRTIIMRGIPLTVALTDYPLELPRLYNGQRTLLVSAIAICKNISASSATFGLFTGAGGTGTTLVSTVALTTLNSYNAFQVLTLTAGATGGLITTSPIFARVGTAGMGSMDLELVISDVG